MATNHTERRLEFIAAFNNHADCWRFCQLVAMAGEQGIYGPTEQMAYIEKQAEKPTVMILLRSLLYERTEKVQLEKKLDRIQRAAINATINNDGCRSGKIEFLQEMEVEEDDPRIPKVQWTGTASVSFEIPALGTDQEMKDAAEAKAEEYIEDGEYTVSVYEG